MIEPPGGHSHFWERALGRRWVLKGAGAAAVVVGVDAIGVGRAVGAPPGSGLPTPIPNGLEIAGTLIHVYLPGPADNPDPSLESPGGEPSTIFHFNGAVGVGVVRGTGTSTNPDGTTEDQFYEVDQRFMRGVYQDRDGRVHNATFGFV
ncbi:MAG: hypothetical protein ACRD29_05085 [Acidimicrobiales bacterium]